jgi:hypothetical protein
MGATLWRKGRWQDANGEEREMKGEGETDRRKGTVGNGRTNHDINFRTFPMMLFLLRAMLDLAVRDNAHRRGSMMALHHPK